MDNATYRGRIAPSPTGFLHLGHARTFWTAQERARDGVLILRNEDLDADRCKREFVEAMYEDLRWFGLRWQEGPDCGGPHAPYSQSERHGLYEAAFQTLRNRGFLYPCTCSRQDVMRALQAPHEGEDEPVYPGTCRNKDISQISGSQRVSWRFRVPDGETISFMDACQGKQSFVAGKDFGDFVVWRHDNIASYQLAVVVDDNAMQISEMVRGMDLLASTARQWLLYQALQFPIPRFYHCPLVLDTDGKRLAKRHAALSLRQLRSEGHKPEELRQQWEQMPSGGTTG